MELKKGNLNTFNLIAEVTEDTFFYYDVENKTLTIPAPCASKLGLDTIYTNMPYSFASKHIPFNHRRDFCRFILTIDKVKNLETYSFFIEGESGIPLQQEATLKVIEQDREGKPTQIFGSSKLITNHLLEDYSTSLEIINTVSMLMLKAQRDMSYCSQALDNLKQFLDAQQVFVALYQKGEPVLLSTSQISNEKEDYFSTKLHLFMFDNEYLKHDGHINYLSDFYFFPKIANFLEVPLYAQDGSIIGYIGIVNMKLKRVSDRVLACISQSVSVAIQNILYSEKLERLSGIDQLSGVANRNAYETYLAKLKTKSLKSLGIVIADINGLKDCNDHEGHLAGDRLIVEVAENLKNIFGNDVVYRVGGDEFFVILENITMEKFYNKIQDFKSLSVHSTASIGSSYRDSSIDIEVMLKEADMAMYQDKEAFYAQNPNVFRR